MPRIIFRHRPNASKPKQESEFHGLEILAEGIIDIICVIILQIHIVKSVWCS